LRNPVLTWRDVDDVDALYVADPFVVRFEDEFLMFLEVVGREDEKGRVGLARSRDGLSWAYDQIVLEEPFHLSYPCVFEWGGTYFMLPETYQAGNVCLYSARRFPTEWTREQALLEGKYVDASLLRAAASWWLFACELGDEVLRLFSSNLLRGPYVEHPESPIVVDSRRARSAGRILCEDGKYLRTSQRCVPFYGVAVDLWEIEELTSAGYREAHRLRILRGSGRGWNRNGMHHLDAMEIRQGRWLAWVDGWRCVWSLRTRQPQ
jgi:hypothetical protein